jgi:hypothetical protein
MIPADASVASLSAIIPHIPKRKNISMLPRLGDADYILVHSEINRWPFSVDEFQSFLEDLKTSDVYEQVVQTGDVFLFRRKNIESGSSS